MDLISFYKIFFSDLASHLVPFQQLEQHFDKFDQFYGRQKIITHSNTAFCKVMAVGAIL